MIVLDTSVALKWVLNEPDSDQARAVMGARLMAPDVWRIEACNGLRRAAACGEIKPEEAEPLLQALEFAPVRDVPTRPLLAAGLTLALQLGHPIYDCLFLALAIDHDCRLLTADRKFGERVEARSAHGPRILLLSEWTS